MPMRYVIAFCAVLGSLLCGCSEPDPLQFETLAFPVTDEITGIHFMDGSNGCAVTGTGEVFLTEDGNSFRKVAALGRRLADVCFLDDDLGLTFGAGGLLARSTDGGATWNVLACDSTIDLQDCVFGDDDRAILIGNVNSGELAGRGAIGISDDEGLTFRFQIDSAAGFVDIDEVPPNHAWIVSNSELLYSTNNGATWERSTHRVAGSHQVFFTDIQHGWEVGDGGLLRYSSDGGWSWQDKLKMTEEPLLCVAAPEVDVIFVGGNRFVAVSTNHGRQWIKDTVSHTGRFNDAHWVSGHVFLAGSGGTIVRFDL